MQLSTILITLVLVHLGTSSIMRNWMMDFENRLPWNEEDAGERELSGLMARSRRGGKIKACGEKVWKMVVMTCGGECTHSEIDIASTCCEKSCSMEEVMSMCCPGRR